MTVKINGTSGLIFEDGILQSYGDDNDLQINHDGSNSYINDAGTGNLRLQTGGSTKLEVTSSGIDVTGGINTTGNVGIGTSSPNVKLEIYDADPYIRLTDSVAPTGYSQVMGTFQGGLVLSADTSNSVANSLLRFDIDGTERMRITTSGNVGIGTSSPSAQLHLSSPNNIGGSSGTFSNAAIRIGTTSSSSMYLDSNEIHSSETINLFSNGTDNGVADYIRFWTGGSAGSERMRIDSSGNMLVGTTAESTWTSTAGHVIRPNSSYTATRDGAHSIIANRLTSDGDIVQFHKDGSTVGSIGNNGVVTYFNFYNSGNVALKGSTNAVAPSTTTGDNRDNAIDLGKSNARYKDLYLSGGVYVGGTGSANYLDDYEEGTWTPGISAGTLTIDTVLFASYTKIGNLVHAQCYMDLNSDGNTTSLVVTGLPFNAVTNGYVSQIVNQGAYSGTVFSRVQAGTNYLRFYEGSQTGVAQQTIDGSHLIFAVTYQTNS